MPERDLQYRLTPVWCSPEIFWRNKQDSDAADAALKQQSDFPDYSAMQPSK